MADLEIWVGGKDDTILTLSCNSGTLLRFTETDSFGDTEVSDFLTLDELERLLCSRNAWMDEKAKALFQQLCDEQKLSSAKSAEIDRLKRQIGKLKSAIRIVEEVEGAE